MKIKLIDGMKSSYCYWGKCLSCNSVNEIYWTREFNGVHSDGYLKPMENCRVCGYERFTRVRVTNVRD